ncbi:MAG: outer membrane lipoprotein carrier protein LolA [Flavobacteriaceae bacterium]|jgi:outer membrane lipoprotein-sorting protein|nr:outer membrane lipoprotein carrier protein LolA [Flavobacteriaceae bacterium]
MKRVLCISLFVMATLGVQAQSSQKAKNYLNDVTKTMNGYKNVSLGFSYVQVDKSSGDSSKEMKGTVDIQNDLYNLNFMGVKRIFDGKKVYTISTEDKEVTVSTYNAGSKDNILPSQLLTFFNTGYNLSWDILQNNKGKQIQYIKLTPTDKKSGIKEILLGIDNKTKAVYNKIQVNKDGSKSTLTVNSFKTNQTLSKNHFTFTASNYSDYYINNID